MKEVYRLKINNIGSINVNPYKKNMTKVQNIQSSAAKADKVEISSAAQELRQTSKVSIERTEKVEALRGQIQAGTYKVDAEAVAKNIIQYYSKN
jgi:negative regulator of flagellin synthesis FlgM